MPTCLLSYLDFYVKVCWHSEIQKQPSPPSSVSRSASSTNLPSFRLTCDIGLGGVGCYRWSKNTALVQYHIPVGSSSSLKGYWHPRMLSQVSDVSRRRARPHRLWIHVRNSAVHQTRLSVSAVLPNQRSDTGNLFWLCTSVLLWGKKSKKDFCSFYSSLYVRNEQLLIPCV